VAAAVAAGVADVADSVVAFTVAASAAAALPGSVRANIALQRYILGAACGRRQETHDFFFSSSANSCDPPCDLDSTLLGTVNDRLLTGSIAFSPRTASSCQSISRVMLKSLVGNLWNLPRE